MLQLPKPLPAYDFDNESKTRTAIEAADAKNQKSGGDYAIGKNGRLILTSPNGAQWLATVSDAGAWVLTAL